MGDDDEDDDDNLRLLNPPSWWPQVVDRNAIFLVPSANPKRHQKRPGASRICIECRQWFTSKRKRKFCTSACQQRAWRKKNPDQYQRILKKYRETSSARALAVKRQQKYRARKKR